MEHKQQNLLLFWVILCPFTPLTTQISKFRKNEKIKPGDIILQMDHSSQIHQIHVKSKILKTLNYSPFDSLIENRKFQKFQLHTPSFSELMAILMIFPAEFEDKM